MAEANARPPDKRRYVSRRLLLTAAGAAAIGGRLLSRDSAVSSSSASSLVPTAWLPFDMPSRPTLAASPKRVWFHWMGGTFPISVDNKDGLQDPTEYWQYHWMPPGGLEGATDHGEYGGYVRHRKPPRTPLTDGRLPYEVLDKMTEIRWVLESGADGFAADLLSVPQDGSAPPAWKHFNQLLDAADEIDDPTFAITLMPDSGVLEADAPAVAAALAEVAHRRVTRVDGRLVIAPYGPESRGPDYWSEVLDWLSRHGHEALFWPCYQAPWREPGQAPAFDALAYGHSRWGTRDPVSTASNSADGRRAPRFCHRRFSKKWMHTVAPGDERPSAGVYSERRNTEQLIAAWHAAIDAGSDCDWVQIATWDDFAEGSNMAPTDSSGFFWLDVNAYFLARYKTGSWPKIIRDAIYLSHRRQPTTGVRYTGRQIRYQTHTGSTPAVDEVEALVFATEPRGTVIMTVGDKSTPFDLATARPVAPGVFSCKVPLTLGKCSAELTRDGSSIAVVSSPTPVADTQIAQDMSYYGASSLRV